MHAAAHPPERQSLQLDYSTGPSAYNEEREREREKMRVGNIVVISAGQASH